MCKPEEESSQHSSIQFNPVPKPELIVDNEQVVLDYVLSDADGSIRPRGS
jgi:hypothetical protein